MVREVYGVGYISRKSATRLGEWTTRKHTNAKDAKRNMKKFIALLQSTGGNAKIGLNTGGFDKGRKFSMAKARWKGGRHTSVQRTWYCHTQILDLLDVPSTLFYFASKWFREPLIEQLTRAYECDYRASSYVVTIKYFINRGELVLNLVPWLVLNLIIIVIFIITKFSISAHHQFKITVLSWLHACSALLWIIPMCSQTIASFVVPTSFDVG
eukprot:SAG31_NODE_109_length_24587_cov_111.480848_2_plen_212_part_00